MKGKIQFQEEQSFVNTWRWYLVLGIGTLSVGGVTLGLLYLKDSEVMIGLVITVITIGGVILFFATSKLYTTIDQDNIYYRYPPFVNSEKKITRADVKKLYVREYKAILEYGGYGYRFRFRSGRALNVAGNIGLQLTLKNDKKLLIGTQKREAMEQAIKRLKENWGMNG